MTGRLAFACADRGRLHGVTGRLPNARVAVGLDAGRFRELVVAAVAALG